MAKFQLDKIAFNKAINALLAEALRIADLEIVFSRDMHAFEAAQNKLGRKEPGEHFRRSIDTLPPNRFFWVGALEGDEIVGLVAARCDESAWTLQEFAKAYWERAFEAEAGESGNRVKVLDGSPVAGQSYRGTFAYLGEALTREGDRNKKLSYVLVRLGLLFAFDEWRPEIAYGWMRDWHAYRGLHTRWGFNGCNYSALEWYVRPIETDWHNLSLLTCDEVGLRNLIRNPAPEILFADRKSSRTEKACPPTSGPEEPDADT
ncbi:hypothetical protein IWQ52_004282 [Labrenzia sp. EL_159]|nr:hypothetical protein [Labrenzia sp. EL_162]MBG6196746.1 hypothetical protein [Labrenzia sp. EL_159]